MAHITEDKNFRLPLSTRPRRYAATLTLDMEAKAFTGQQTIELDLDKPSNEIILHANALQLGQVTFRAGGKQWRTSDFQAVPVSETVVLRFGEQLPAGAAALDVAWT
ncbi:MAG TPA: M1 family peptidase, partial [Archangium sp.]|nr:M1 family peptidase [Archangium sp.]